MGGVVDRVPAGWRPEFCVNYTVTRADSWDYGQISNGALSSSEGVGLRCPIH